MKVAVVGSFVVDLMARTPHLPVPGETVKGSYFKAGPGGKGFNQAVAAYRAGSDLMFSTKLGEDDFARIATEFLDKDGIERTYVFRNQEEATGAALITVDETSSQNEIVVVPGACATYNDEDIAMLEKALNGCAYLLLQLEINTDANEKIIQMACGKGIRVILNPAPVQQISSEVYQRVHIITPNEVEAQILTGLPYTCDDDCKAIAEEFFRRGVHNVVLTLGKRGAYVNDGHTESFIDNYDMKVLDSTGAGDAFNGGLLAALGNGDDLRTAAAYANVVSNIAVTKLGTAPAMPKLEEIEGFIKQYGLH